MPPESEFADYVVELLQALGSVYAKPMFGGHGIFIDGLMFGLIADDTLYFKTDSANRLEFDHRGLAAFRYRRAGRDITMSYRQAPPEALDDSETLLPWAQSGYAATRRQAAKKATI